MYVCLIGRGVLLRVILLRVPTERFRCFQGCVLMKHRAQPRITLEHSTAISRPRRANLAHCRLRVRGFCHRHPCVHIKTKGGGGHRDVHVARERVQGARGVEQEGGAEEPVALRPREEEVRDAEFFDVLHRGDAVDNAGDGPRGPSAGQT